jgi:phosphotransferase system enzyme I (PtsI)
MSIIINGEGISKGICIGQAIYIDKNNIDYAPSFIKKSQVDKEIERFKKSLSKIKVEYKKSINKVIDNAAITKLIETQLYFIEDKSFQKNIINKIKNDLHTVNWSIATEYQKIEKSFEGIQDKYIKERLIDIKQMVMSLLSLLRENKSGQSLKKVNLHNKIVITDEITPKEIIDIYYNNGLGVITSHGSKSSHSAILSKSLSLPMMVKADASNNIIRNNDFLIMHPENNEIIINPDQNEIKYFKSLDDKNISLELGLKKILKKKSITSNGKIIKIMSNIELSEEVKFLDNNSDGIGLYRTEYLYMNRSDLPTEEEQVIVYKKVFKKMMNKSVTIRTLDIGSDKEVSENIKAGDIAKNPALGLRGIRYSLVEKNIFKTQIKAMLRAGYNKKLRILIPMITNVNEIYDAKAIINNAKIELKEERKKYTDDYALGVMVEVPACALQASELSKHIDFMSIGTNDLVQYTLAIDRIDDEVSNLYDPTEPAVLNLIKKVIESCDRAKIDVSVCGEMAGEAIYTKLLLGLGLKSFSMHPQAIPEVKNIILNSDTEKIKKTIAKVLKCDDRSTRESLIKNL